MWTEWAPHPDRVEYQTFPRLAASAEVGWTNLNQKNYRQFLNTLELLKIRWKKLDINFAPESDYNQ